MNTKTILKIILCCTSFLLARVVVGPLVFTPTMDVPHTRRLVQEWEISLDHLDIVVNDWDLTRDILFGFSVDVDLSQLVVVTDTFRDLRHGGPKALDREFNVISQDLEVRTLADGWSGAWNETEVVHGSSELEGLRVQFCWEQGGISRAFHPADQSPSRETNEQLLKGLTEDMDLRLLLPSEAVEVGDSWDIDLDRLPDLLSPGGYFAWNNELKGSAGALGDALDPALMGDLRHLLGEMLQGEATVTYVREGRGLSELELNIDVYTVQGTHDLADLATRILGPERESITLDVESLDIDLAMKARGLARWDSRRGHMSDLELAGEMESQMDLELTLDWGRQVYRIRIGTQISGEWTQELKLQR